ncbi:hypothetical protein SprV_0100174000 [Sparganum proliferum]
MVHRLQPFGRPKTLSKLLKQWLEARPLTLPSHLFSSLLLCLPLPFCSQLYSTVLPHGRKSYGEDGMQSRPTAKGTAPLLSADETTLLIEKMQIFQRWAEHFRGALNRPSTISDIAIARLPQVETNTDLDLSKKPSGFCSGYPAGKRLDRTKSLRRSTDTAAPNS